VLTGPYLSPWQRAAEADRKPLMARAFPTTTLLLAGLLTASPAAAQFPNIFDSIFGVPPRPPGDVPSQRRMDPPSREQLLPPGPPPGPPRGQPGGRIQTQPLPPPPGGASAPPAARTAPQPTLPGLPPGQRQPRGTATLQPPDDGVIEPPAQKVPNPTAVFSGLDKITGRIISFDVAINETVRFGALEVTPRACYTRPATEATNTDGFIEVDELTLQGELRRIFTGWMFAASPGLNAVEHPIYDIWLADCKGAAPPPVAEAPAEAAPAPRPQRSQQQRTQQPPQQQQQRRAVQPLPPPPIR
jgi:hypothetical protein